MAEKKQEDKLGEALLKVALGYQVAEITEEYAEVDGELKLMKRKKTKKDVPPDLKAVQMLLAQNGEEYVQWSEEELEQEKKRLLELIEKEEKPVKSGAAKTKRKTTVKKTSGKKSNKERKK